MRAAHWLVEGGVATAAQDFSIPAARFRGAYMHAVVRVLAECAASPAQYRAMGRAAPRLASTFSPGGAGGVSPGAGPRGWSVRGPRAKA